MANEKRLIDANALPIKFDGHTVSVWKCDLDAAPTVDAVEVVRCKDCVCYQPNQYDEEGAKYCKCWCDWLPTDPDDFCSYGERREGE